MNDEDDGKPIMQGRCPFMGRRDLLRGLAAGGAMLGALGAGKAQAVDRLMQEPPGRSHEQAMKVQPFFGARQAGIVTPSPAAGLVVSFDVLGSSLADVERLFRTLTQRLAFLTQGGKVPELDPRFPPADSGVLGSEITPDNLTITASVGASLFDDRFGLKDLKPRRLTEMRSFPNDALDPEWCHGDLLLQFCANTPEANIHALRDVIKSLPDLLAVRWQQAGFLPAADPDRPKETARNLLGFKDGTGNPDTADADEMKRILWVGEQSDEPAWARDGSYQVVRIIRHFVERWDRAPLNEQERIFGRMKASGAPLGGTGERDAIDYAADPAGKVTPLNAHIRLANPRTPETQENLILRRPFNYMRGITKAGQLDMGLIFICFQADLEKGFVTVQRRLDGEPLEEYIKPTGGGYFFALPGARSADNYLGQSLIETAQALSTQSGFVHSAT